MKLLHYLNCILMSMTLLMFALWPVNVSFFGTAIWLTMALACYQMTVGFFAYLFRLKNMWFLGYLLGVGMFFLLVNQGMENLWVVPGILAFYFTFIIYRETKINTL